MPAEPHVPVLIETAWYGNDMRHFCLRMMHFLYFDRDMGVPVGCHRPEGCTGTTFSKRVNDVMGSLRLLSLFAQHQGLRHCCVSFNA